MINILMAFLETVEFNKFDLKTNQHDNQHYGWQACKGCI